MTPFELLAPTYLQILGALSNWLDKAEQELPFAQANALLSARLAPDMFPLSTQIRFACVQALEGMHRLAGADFPPLHATLLEEGRDAADRPGCLSMPGRGLQRRSPSSRRLRTMPALANPAR